MYAAYTEAGSMQTHLERTIMNSVIELNANKITTSV
jgi:hypothetical protein